MKTTVLSPKAVTVASSPIRNSVHNQLSSTVLSVTELGRESFGAFRSPVFESMKRKLFSDSETPAYYGGTVGLSEERSNSTNPWTFKPYSSRYYDILAKRKQLPVYEFKNALEVAVRDNQVVIVEGETGSGQYLLESEQYISPTLRNTGS